MELFFPFFPRLKARLSANKISMTLKTVMFAIRSVILPNTWRNEAYHKA